MKSALIIVDLQHNFMAAGALAVGNAEPGLVVDYCVKATALDSSRTFKTYMVPAACQSVAPESANLMDADVGLST